MELLDAIDELRSLDIDKDIPLPQIVVIGEQNAGKSSVLEAISGVPFPTNDGLCTRFATEVVLRRSSKTQTNARLLVKGDHGFGGAFDSSEFERDIDGLAPLTANKIPHVVECAARALDVLENDSFSDDVLRIEVSGPEQDHLSLIDLPGFFSYTKATQDPTAPDKVKLLASRYMTNQRSIILAVIHAKSDYQTQETLEMLKQVDRPGLRTMGVITSIDRLEKGTDLEAQFLALSLNKSHPLSLGWHTLRNPSFNERKDPRFDRFRTEDGLFQTTPWSSIPHTDRGAPQLKAKLSRTLMAHIGRELGGVIAAIDEKIVDEKSTLERLGTERSTPEQRRLYLSQIAAQHQRLVNAGLEGSYEDPFFITSGQRLRAAVRDRFEHFERLVRTEGHKWDFWTENNPLSSNITRGADLYLISGVMSHEKGPLVVTREQYLKKVNTLLSEHRGTELQGSFNPALVGTLFRDQSCRWRSQAAAMISDIVTMVTVFITAVTRHVTDDRRAQLIYRQRLKPALETRESAMIEKLTELMGPFHSRTPATCNPAFLSRLDTLSRIKYEPHPSETLGFLDKPVDRPACDKLVAALESYYDIARASFVDNIVSLGVEQCLLDGLDGILCSHAVNGMNAGEIDILASEFDEDAQLRRTTQVTLKKLQAGRDVCREHDRSATEPSSRLPLSQLSQKSVSTRTDQLLLRLHSGSSPPRALVDHSQVD